MGRLVAIGTLPLTRHAYLLMLEQGRRSEAGARHPSARLVRAHVLSRTAHGGCVMIYDGVLRDFYSKADGTISYVVLRGACAGTVKVDDTAAQRVGATIALDGSTTGDAGTSLLLLTNADIANVYFEHLPTVTRSPDDERKLDEALSRLGQPAIDERQGSTPQARAPS